MIPEVTQPRKSVGRDLNLYSLLPRVGVGPAEHHLVLRSYRVRRTLCE